MYICIMEGGEVYKAESVTEDDFLASNNGILDIINTETMKQHYDGGWHDIEKWGDW